MIFPRLCSYKLFITFQSAFLISAIFRVKSNAPHQCLIFSSQLMFIAV